MSRLTRPTPVGEDGRMSQPTVNQVHYVPPTPAIPVPDYVVTEEGN